MPDDLLEAPARTAEAPAGGDGGDTAIAERPAPAPVDGKGKADPAPTDRTGRTADPAKATPAKAGDDESDDDDGLDIDDEDGGKAPATWPEDWREKLAGTDDKWLKELKRFTSPETFAKSQRALRQKLSSGEYKRAALPADATDAEKAEWRKENDIPDKPEDYGVPEIKGYEWGESDTAIAGDFLSALHAANTPKPVAEAALKWYAKFQTQQVESRAEADRHYASAREDALRAEWGPGDYRPHVNLAKQMFNDDAFIGKDLREAFGEARMPGGMRLTHHPDFIRFLATQGLEKKGTAGLISGEQGVRMGSRLDEIKKIRDTDIDRYYSDGLDKEYADINEKMDSRRR